MEASGGGISLEYLQKVSYARLTYLARAARIRRLRSNLDVIYNVNMGYSGEREKISKLHDEIDSLVYAEDRTDREKLKMWKQKLKDKRKAAKPKKKDK